MKIHKITKVLEGPLNQKYVNTMFTKGLDTVKMSKYFENGKLRSKRIMVEGYKHNKYMEASYDKNGKYIKNSFFSSTNTVPRNLDIIG